MVHPYPPGSVSEAVVPDHLVVWLTGVGPDRDDPVVLDDELGGGFSLAGWVQDVRTGYPSSAIATVYEGSDHPDPWWPALRRIATASTGPGRFTGDIAPTSLARQREWTRSCLEDLRSADDHPWSDTAISDAVLVVDELVVNVEQHAGGWFTVDLQPSDGTVAIGVTDGHPEVLASPRSAAPTSPDGRGLKVVETVAVAWGQLVRPSSKTIWAQVPMRASVAEMAR